MRTVGNENKGSIITQVLITLGRYEVEGLLSMSEALAEVEKAFRLEAEGKAIMPPKLYLDLPEYKGDFRAMPAYINGTPGLKWVSVYPDNWRHNSPSPLGFLPLP